MRITTSCRVPASGRLLRSLQCLGALCVAASSDESLSCLRIHEAPESRLRIRTAAPQALATRRIRVIGVPLDMGASRRGVDMGPSAMRVAGLEARLEALGHHVTDGGNIRVEIAETQASGSDNARYLKQIAETCTPHRRGRSQDAGRRHDAAGAGRRPLAGRRLRLRRGRVLPPPGPEDRRDLDRRPLRHQHAGDLALGQRARHAAGGAAGPGPGAARQHLRLRAQDRRRKTRC